jgi:protein-S-isoprenylcysteine O-methyltransferase Ste14
MWYLDPFGIVGLLLNLLWIIKHIGYGVSLRRTRGGLRKGFGLSFDPLMIMWVIILIVGESLVVIDYAYWHLFDIFREPLLQGTGVVLFVFGLIWLAWVDKYLAAHFAKRDSEQRLIINGPFKYIRHPRYTGLILTKIASALIFSSLIGWIVVLTWIFVLYRRIRLEEPYLKDIFGEEYEKYSKQTWRLLPKIF